MSNAERNILSPHIDAMLDAPNAERVTQWFKLAGKEPGGIALSVQTGVFVEETVEFMRSMTIASAGGGIANALVEACVILDAVSEMLKAGEAHVYFHDRLESVDGMADIDVTLNGIAFLGGFDKAGADKRVIDSLFDKFNEDGSAVIKPGGKIGKREGWVAPDLTPFIGTMPETPEEQQPFTFEAESPATWAKALAKQLGGSVNEGVIATFIASAMDHGSNETLKTIAAQKTAAA